MSRNEAGESNGQRPCSTKPSHVSILFLVDDITQFGGIQTRVVEQLRCLKDSNDVDFSVISRCYPRNLLVAGSAIRLLARFIGRERVSGFSYVKIPHGGHHFVYEAAFLLNLLLSVVLVFSWCLLRRPNLVCGHNIECGTTAITVSRILGIPNAIDLHGVEVDEYLEHHPRWNPWSLSIRFRRQLEKSMLEKADLVICVSDAHRRVLETRASAPPRCVVAPCFSDERLFRFDEQARVEVRSVLNLKDGELLFVHTGILPSSFDSYNPLHFFATLPDLSDKKLLLLVTTDSLQRAFEQMPENVKDRVIVMHVPREEVPRYLSAADIGLLLRKETVVNRVASPTKFSEYLLCGLPVIMTDNLGDASLLVRENEIGLVLSSERLLKQDGVSNEEIHSILTSEVRHRARMVGERTLSQRSICSTYLAALKSVAMRV